jgi:DNA-directed RNA polymerase alpha subunit
MSDITKESLLDSFALEAMKSLIAQRANASAYKIAAEAYVIAEKMMERRKDVLNQWSIEENIVEQQIELLNLTVRVENALKAEGIFTVQMLQKCTERRLLSIVNLGRKGVRQIIESLNAFNGCNLRDYL